MASWTDEFDIDDSDILGALKARRKDLSQLASPPWPLARPAPLQQFQPNSSSADHHAVTSTASLLKRFQRPRSSPDVHSPSQNGVGLVSDPGRKRPRNVDLASSLPLNVTCTLKSRFDADFSGEDPDSLVPAVSKECDVQIEHSNRTQIQHHGVNVEPVPCKNVFTFEEQCQSLSSHATLRSPMERGTLERHPEKVQSVHSRRHEDLTCSQPPLRGVQRNVGLSRHQISTGPAHTNKSVHQSLSLDGIQQNGTGSVEPPENCGDERLQQSTNVSQQNLDFERRLKNVRSENSMQQSLGRERSKAAGKSVPHDRLSMGPQGDSRSVRFLQKDLCYQIPGPAGAIQIGLGLRENSLFENNNTRRNNTEPGRTSAFEDADFKNVTWLKAKDFLQKSSIQISTISSLKTSRTENRVCKLLAVIKSCTPNGCGDAMLSFKDQTDSIHGIVNRRVFSETEFGRIIEPGAVILLHEVAVFSPTPYAHYLNITINNVEKVFEKDLHCLRGECSRAAFRTAAERDQFTDAGHQHSALNLGMKDHLRENFCDTNTRIDHQLAEEDDLEMLLSQTQHRRRKASEDGARALHAVGNTTGVDTASLPCSPTRGKFNESCLNPVNDGYDQLLDDTDLFP